MEALPATLVTGLSHPELLFFIRLTTEMVTGGGGGGEDCCSTVQDEVNHHGRDKAGLSWGPSP